MFAQRNFEKKIWRPKQRIIRCSFRCARDEILKKSKRLRTFGWTTRTVAPRIFDVRTRRNYFLDSTLHTRVRTFAKASNPHKRCKAVASDIGTTLAILTGVGRAQQEANGIRLGFMADDPCLFRNTPPLLAAFGPRICSTCHQQNKPTPPASGTAYHVGHSFEGRRTLESRMGSVPTRRRSPARRSLAAGPSREGTRKERCRCQKTHGFSATTLLPSAVKRHMASTQQLCCRHRSKASGASVRLSD